MKNSAYGIVSILFGIIGIAFLGSWLAFFPIAVAIVLAMFGVADSTKYKWSSITGIVLAMIGLVLCSATLLIRHNDIRTILSSEGRIQSVIPLSEYNNTHFNDDYTNSADVGDTEIGRIDADRGIFNVTLTIPAEYSEGITQESLDRDVQELGFKSATLNTDGSVTYVISKAQHAELIRRTEESIYEALESMKESPDYPSIKDIKTNDDFTLFTVTTTNSELSISESIAVLGLYMYGGMYKAFCGNHMGNIHVDFVNEQTGEIIDSFDSDNFTETYDN